MDREEGKAGPIYDDKHLETRVETRQKAVRIALGMCTGTKAMAVTRTGAIQGRDWGLAAILTWRGFPFWPLPWVMLLCWSMGTRGCAALSLLNHRGC